MRGEGHEARGNSQKAYLILNIVSQHFFEVSNVASDDFLQFIVRVRLELERVASGKLLGPVLTGITNLLHR